MSMHERVLLSDQRGAKAEKSDAEFLKGHIKNRGNLVQLDSLAY